MLFLIEIGIFLTILLAWWFKNDKDRYSRMPPGPLRFPILGNIPQLALSSPFPAKALKELSEKHGDIFFLKIGGKEQIVFNTYDTAKEILQYEYTGNRSQDFEFIKARQPGDKPLANDETWHNLRRFTMRNLREFGFGKSKVMDVVINEEIEKFIKNLEKKLAATKNNVFDEPDMFNVTMINVLWRLASGKSYELDDPVIQRLVKLNGEFINSTNLGIDLWNIFPVIRNLFPKWSMKEKQEKSCKALFDYGKELLQEQRRNGSYKNDPQSFIDVFTAKVDESKSDPATAFNDDQFVMVVLDLLLGGSDTSSNTLNFGVLYMICFPEVQEKVQEELDRVLAEDEKITFDMKPKLPYTTATVLEMLRYSTVIPVISPREATQDFYFRGHFFIPKGMALQANIHAIHNDKDTWMDPQNFRPERFLNKAGTEVDSKMTAKMLSFGAGKRYCLGQSLSEVTTFLYFATMLRKFKFIKVPHSNITTEPVVGITLSPQRFPVEIVSRNKQK